MGVDGTQIRSMWRYICNDLNEMIRIKGAFEPTLLLLLSSAHTLSYLLFLCRFLSVWGMSMGKYPNYIGQVLSFW